MKWARKKKGSSNSSHSSLINHLFPISWFSKFKLINGGCSEKISKQKMQQQEVILQKDQSFKKPNSRNLEKKQSLKRDKKTEQIDTKEAEEIIFEVQPNRITRTSRSHSFTYPKCKFSSKDQNFNKFKQSQKGGKKTEQVAAKEAEKIIFEVQPDPITRKRRSFSYPNCNFGTIKQESLLEVLNLDDSSTMPENPGFLEDIKFKKDDEITGSISICKKKKRYNKKRTKPYSPRTMAKIECKIRAIEDLKKSRKREKKKVVFDDSYAVMKNSFDPRRDFRDSMIEMIVVKRIEKPEDLEKLLACYLTLNCDEYHDLIIKVFRQVWFELSDMYHDHD